MRINYYGEYISVTADSYANLEQLLQVISQVNILIQKYNCHKLLVKLGPSFESGLELFDLAELVDKTPVLRLSLLVETKRKLYNLDFLKNYLIDYYQGTFSSFIEEDEALDWLLYSEDYLVKWKVS